MIVLIALAKPVAVRRCDVEVGIEVGLGVEVGLFRWVWVLRWVLEMEPV